MVNKRRKTSFTITPLSVFLGIVIAAAVITSLQLLGSRSSSLPYEKIPSPTVSPASQETIPSVDTTNWKFYENSQYGFSFLYPPDWSLQGSGQHIRFDIAPDPNCSGPNNPCGGVPAGPVVLTIVEKPQGTTLEEFAYVDMKKYTWPDQTDKYIPDTDQNMTEYQKIPIPADNVIKGYYPGQCGGQIFYLGHGIYILRFIFDCADTRVLQTIKIW